MNAQDDMPKKGPRVITLAAEATIAQADALFGACKTALAESSSIEVDAQAVARLDTTAAQLLVALKASAHRRKLPFRVRCNATAEQALRQLGAGDLCETAT